MWWIDWGAMQLLNYYVCKCSSENSQLLKFTYPYYTLTIKGYPVSLSNCCNLVRIGSIFPFRLTARWGASQTCGLRMCRCPPAAPIKARLGLESRKWKWGIRSCANKMELMWSVSGGRTSQLIRFSVDWIHPLNIPSTFQRWLSGSLIRYWSLLLLERLCSTWVVLFQLLLSLKVS